MPIKSYFDEFKQNYEKPQVDGLIVGFSGIDPQRKSSGDNSYNNSTLSQEQRDIVRQLIREALSVIDFSDCNCDPTQLSDEQKDIIAKLIELKLDEINPCECDNSSLSDEQRSIIRTIIDERLRELNINFDGGNIDDNDEPKPQYEPVDESNLDHEKLKGMLGGDSNGHFHLTQDELLKIASYPAFPDIKHENLPDLMGGCSGQHFHLDSNQFRKLDILIKTFFQDGSDEVIIKPPIPDIPDEPQDDFDPYGGLPSGTPPSWELRMLPNGYSACENSYKMYYGITVTDKKTPMLYVTLKDSTGNNYGQTTTNLTSWSRDLKWISKNFSASHYACYYSTVRNALFYVGKPGTTTNATGGGYTPLTGGGAISSASNVNGYFNSLCFSDLLNVLLMATDKGDVVLVTIVASNKHTLSNIYRSGLTVNPTCAAWHPTTAVFCLTGKEGTSTSFDGETWTLNTSAPHDLRDLSYRQDIDNFIAWSGEDKTFYASNDGIKWNQLSDTHIPLNNISTVHYEPSNGWFCAVGIGDGNAYFSKNLKAWVPTKLRNNSIVDVADVIFMPSTGLYVAMPTSGTYYYSFNPDNWTD